MAIKAILCDFDGSLVDREKKYNQDLGALIKKITSQNIHFSLATGRAYYSHVNKILDELEIKDFHIFNGGALIYNNHDHKSYWSEAISNESVKKIIKYFLQAKINFALETEKCSYMSKLMKYPSYTPFEYLKSLSELNGYSNIIKIIVFGRTNKFTEKEIYDHEKNLKNECKDITIFKFNIHGYGMDITSEKATKHTAVLEYEKILKIPRTQMVCIGDGYNDYPLFTASGYKIALENAPDELKEIADFVAPMVENNGTVIALNHIIERFKI